MDNFLKLWFPSDVSVLKTARHDWSVRMACMHILYSILRRQSMLHTWSGLKLDRLIENWLINWFIVDLLSDLLIERFIAAWLSDWLSDLLRLDWVIDFVLIDWLIGWLIDWWLIYWLFDWLIDWLIVYLDHLYNLLQLPCGWFHVYQSYKQVCPSRICQGNLIVY